MSKLLLLASFLFLSGLLFSENLGFRHLDNRDGLSQINILSIYQDETGAMWFGSIEGLNRYDGQNIDVYRASQTDVGLTQNEIYTICGNKKGSIYVRAGRDLVKYNLYKQKFTTIKQGDINDTNWANDTLWVATNNKILFYTEKTDSLTSFYEFRKDVSEPRIYLINNSNLIVSSQDSVFEIPKSKPHLYKSSYTPYEIKVVCKDSKNNTWIGTSKNGVYKITSNQDTIHYTYSKHTESLSNNQIRCIIEDNLGYIWVGTFFGLNKFDPDTEKWTSYTQGPNNEHGLSHNSIFALYKDVQGTIWIGTYFGGVNYFNPEKDKYNIYGANSNDVYSVSYPFVGNMVEDKSGNLWICTEGGGLNYFNRKTLTFTKYLHNDKDNKSIAHNNIKSIWYDRNHEQLYLGTYTGGLSILDIQKNKFKTLKHDPDNKKSLPNDVVNAMQYYKNGLILLTQGGITRFNLQDETFSDMSENPEVNSFLKKSFSYQTFLIDSQDRIWLALSMGGLICIDLKTNDIKEFYHSNNNEGGIGKFKIVKIFESSQRRIFFGTIGSGLFEYNSESNNFINYTAEKKEILSNYCYYIAEMPYKYLVILHNQGATFFDPATCKLQNSYEFSRQNFNQGSTVYITGDNEMFFGGYKGLASFNDELLHSPPDDFNMYFNHLFVNNKEIFADDDTGIISKAIMFSDELHLKYDQNNLIFDFATSGYASTDYFEYEYMLEGFSDEWIPIPLDNRITYTNLNSGEYVLIVRVLQKNSTPVSQISIYIKIQPPYYATIWAYIIYAVVALAMLYSILRFKTNQTKLQASLEFERKDKERIEELNKVKLQFFTNISHEFRTPLTLIMGQMEVLLGADKLNPSTYNKLLHVYKNALHLRNLISELLDFRKQEQGYLRLRIEKTDIVSFTKEIFTSFYEYGMKRHLNYKFEEPCFPIEVWIDLVQLQKVIYNLLSNAFKYTKEHDTISISFGQQQNTIQIYVRDTGAGIAQKYIDKIFDRFYQVDSDSAEFTLGTGIGLALSKGIVELHKGNISVESELGKGSTFVITLQLGNAHFAEDMIQGGNKNKLYEDFDNKDIEFLKQNLPREVVDDTGSPANRRVMLIVEDNTELLDMLEEVFSPFYKIYRAENGRRGLELTKEIQPDIVVSDVMMPEMSGKEMCYKIKNDINTSHIPVVLLTAQTSIEYTIEGYMFGADDYITKPFNIRILISRCNNLIQNRKMLLERLKNTEEKPAAIVNTLNEYDLKLIEKAMSIIRDNFNNIDFNMDALAVELGMGRSKLYSKMKEVTGLTPNEFTLKLKLDEGMRLLNTDTHLTIAEISYMLGFSSARYFSQCFKSFYGVAPVNIRKSKSE